MKASKINIAISSLIILFLILFYILTSTYPIHGDDWTYRFVFTKDYLVTGISDIFYSQSIHWVTWGGRFVAHSLVQGFLLFDKVYFNIANTICYAFCCACITKIAFKDNFLRNWLLILLSLWIVLPSPGGTILWLTGSFNYLWTSCFTVTFLCLLLSNNRNQLIAAIPLGLIAGNGHESLSLGISAALVLFAITTPRKSNLFYVAIICYILGFLSNALAPGNFVRVDSVGAASQQGIASQILFYLKNFLKVGYRLTFNWSDLGVQCCTFLWIIAGILWYRLKARIISKEQKNKKVLLTCLLIGGLCSLGLNLISGTAYPRAVYGFCFLSYLACIYALSFYTTSKVYAYLPSCFILLNALMYPIAYQDIQTFRENINRTVQCCEKGEHIATALPDREKLKNSRFAGYGPSPCVLHNWNLELLYNVKDISLLDEDVATSIKQNLPTIAKLRTHEKTILNDRIAIMRLASKPINVSENLSHKPLAAANTSLFSKVGHWIKTQKKPEQQCFVIYTSNNYYLYWIKNTYNGSIGIHYKDEGHVNFNID